MDSISNNCTYKLLNTVNKILNKKHWLLAPNAKICHANLNYQANCIHLSSNIQYLTPHTPPPFVNKLLNGPTHYLIICSPCSRCTCTHCNTSPTPLLNIVTPLSVKSSTSVHEQVGPSVNYTLRFGQIISGGAAACQHVVVLKMLLRLQEAATCADCCFVLIFKWYEPCVPNWVYTLSNYCMLS